MVSLQSSRTVTKIDPLPKFKKKKFKVYTLGRKRIASEGKLKMVKKRESQYQKE